MEVEEEEEEESWEMSRPQILEAISKLYSLLNINININHHPLHYELLDWRTRHVLKSLLDAAQHNLLFHPPSLPSQMSLCTQHSHSTNSDEQQQSFPTQSIPKQLVSDLPKLTVSDCPQTIIKRCRLCNSKHSLSSNLLGTQKVMQKTTKETLFQPRFPPSSPYCSNSRPREVERLPGQQQSFCQMACNTPTATASISRLHPASEDRIETGSECRLHRMADLHMPFPSVTDKMTHQVETGQTFQKRMLEEPVLQVQSPTQKNAVAWPSEKHQYVHGLMVPLSMHDEASNSTTTAAKVKTKNQMSSQAADSLVLAPMANLQKDSNLSTSSILQPESVTSTSQTHNKHLKTPTATRPTLLHYDSSSSNKAEVRLRSRSRTPKRLNIGSKHMMSQRQIKHSKEKWSSSASSHSYTPSSSLSYSWTSRQQTSTDFSSNSSQQSSSHQESASPRNTQRESDSGSSSPTPSYHRRGADGQDGDNGSRSTRYRSSGQRPVGRFRRFKDKLGLIFHHHHHHHHHHHSVDKTKQSTSRRHTTRTSKHLHKMVEHDEKPELHAEKAVTKHRNSLTDRKQAHHFHELVQGLMHHIRLSKKSKRSETSEAGIRHHGHKKNLGRMLQQHGGVKLPKGKQVKVGIKGKKPQLKETER
ncbi:Protein KOKOPELLI [Linum perenne]